MQINRVAEFRNVHSIREDRLSLPALKKKKGDGYWTVSDGELRERVRDLGAALLSAGIRAGAVSGRQEAAAPRAPFGVRFFSEIPLKGKSAPTVVYGG